jgi:hypothetical protein
MTTINKLKFRTYNKSFIFIILFASSSYNGFGQSCSSYTDWYQATWNSGQVVELVGTGKLYTPTYSSTNAPLTDSWNRCEVSSPCTNYWKLSGTCSTILPIELSLFNAVLKGDFVDINWQTTSEKNNDYFILEKSYDTKKWSTIANVKGNGTTNSIQNYNWKYIVDFSGICYYRLTQVDFDGTREIFNIISTKNEYENEIIIYPNPISDYFYLEYFSENEDEFNIIIESYNGQVVYQQNYLITKGENIINISSETFLEGLYIVVVANNFGTIVTKKFVKN